MRNGGESRALLANRQDFVAVTYCAEGELAFRYLNMRRRARYICSVAVCLLLSACSNIRVEDEREMSAMPPNAPRVIYVRVFDLEPGTFQAESGILPMSPISAGVPGAFVPRIGRSRTGKPPDSWKTELRRFF
jgi:hypothetical protein